MMNKKQLTRKPAVSKHKAVTKKDQLSKTKAGKVQLTKIAVKTQPLTTKNKSITSKNHLVQTEEVAIHGKEQLTTKHKTILVELYFLHRNYQLAADAFVGLHPQFSGLGRGTVYRIIQKFRETGSVADRARTGRPKSANNELVAELISARIDKNPQVTMRELAKDGGISKASVVRILKNSRFQPYKVARAKAAKQKGKRETLTLAENTQNTNLSTKRVRMNGGIGKTSVARSHEMNNRSSKISVAGFHELTGFHTYMPAYDDGCGPYYVTQ